MTGRAAARAGTIAAAVLALPCSILGAQIRTDVVTLRNGDRITGEVVRLYRGRLEFKTDDAGTLYLEWDKLTSVVAARFVEVRTADDRMFLGTLPQTADRWIAVANVGGTTSLPMWVVTTITPIGRGFWGKVDGSIDIGFTYTRSSGIAQLNVQSDTEYRAPGYEGQLTASLTQTEQSDGSNDDDRWAVQASYQRYPWRRWFITAVGRLEANGSLGLVLRSQAGGAIGPRFINSGRAQMTAGAGLVFNDELGVDVERRQNVDALFLFNSSFYTYDRPRTNLDVTAQYYLGLTDTGRHRLQLDAATKRELWKDFFLALTMFDTFDSRPPNPEADRNDVGFVMSIGWTY